MKNTSKIFMLAFRKGDNMPNEVWANVELILKNAHLKFHEYTKKYRKNEQCEIVYMIDDGGLDLTDIASLSTELSIHYNIKALYYDPGSSILKNKTMYPYPTCKVILGLNH